MEERLNEMNSDRVFSKTDIHDPLNRGGGAKKKSYGENELKTLLKISQNLMIDSSAAVEGHIDF